MKIALDMDGVHTCPKCKQSKLWTAFNKNKARKNGYEVYCRECVKVYVKLHYARKFSSARDWRYRRDYGITIQDYQAMFDSQGGVCAMCKRATKRNLSVDHDHETGKIRGLLCPPCNRALGTFGDNLGEIVARVTSYLGGEAK